MTRAGTVADQPPLPSQTNIGRLRDTGTQKEAAGRKDATAPSDNAEKEFGEVLSKLSGAEGKGADRAAHAGKRTNLRQMQQREIAGRITQDEAGDKAGDGAAGDCSACDDVNAAKVPALAAQPEDTKPDDTQADTLKGNLAPAQPPQLQQIAAIATPPPIQPSAEGQAQADEPARSRGANRAAGPTIPPNAILDASLESAEPNPALAQGHAVKAKSEQDIEVRTPITPPLPTDPNLTRAGAPEAAIAKGQLQQDNEGRPLAGAKDFVLASASDDVPEGHEPSAKVDVPKANVLRRETHFAPVSAQSARAHSGASAAKSSHHGAVANVTGNEPGGAPSAPSVNAASLPGQGQPAIAVPPAQQIAERIAAEAPAFEAAGRAGAGSDQPSAKPTLKIVQIQLQPADLGIVTVRIELKASDLKLHVETHRREAADIIRGDQDTLSKLLRSAGYGVDAGSIRITEGDRTLASAQAGQQTGQQGAQTNLQSSAQSHSGWSERQESAQRGQRGTHGGNTQTPADRNETHGTTTNRTGRDLYI